MVIKKTWNEMLTENQAISTFITTDIENLATGLDSAFNTKYGVQTKVKSVLDAIKEDYLTADGVWEDLPIYLSDYKLKDRRVCLQIQDNLIRYLRFLTKMVTDEGIGRIMSLNRNFTNTTSSSSTDNNLYSETPQIELNNFEDAIKYASNVAKNTGSSTTQQGGGSGETSKSTNWEEGKKNLDFAFYNEIVDYIIAIPNMLYNYFALDSRPITELLCARRRAIRNLFNL